MMMAMKMPMHVRVAASFYSETVHRVSISSSCSSPTREAVTSVKKTSEILKKALTDRHARWPKKDWYSKTKPHWPSAGEEVGQSSHDKWKSSQPVKTTPQMTRFRDVQQAIIMATV